VRSLTVDAPMGGGTSIPAGGEATGATISHGNYEENLLRLKRIYHSRCLFGKESSSLPDIEMLFDDQGALHGRFTAGHRHQGYEGCVHGGVITAIIDASMAQCLMGHGVVGYTADISVKYRHPVTIKNSAEFITRIVGINIGILYTLDCKVVQGTALAVEATGRFFKFA